MGRKILNGVMNAEVILAIVFLLLLGVPYLVGCKPAVVMSGSMEPKIHTGALAYIDKTKEAEDVKKGDIISYKVNGGLVVTHRVVEVHKEKREYITKGDANETIDFAPVSFDELEGETVFSIPYLGYVVKFLTTAQGWIAIIAVIVVQELMRKYFESDEEEKEEKQRCGS